MKSVNKTKNELIDELESLRERISEMEGCERNYRQAPENFGERMDQSRWQIERMHEAIFCIFDRKLEFVNDRFAELFGISEEEACSSNLDPMTFVAPENRRVIGEQYRQGCRGAFTTKQLNFTGLSRDGLKIECETLLLFIPYKWGISILGTLRSTSLRGRIDKTSQSDHSALRFALNTVPKGVLYMNQRFVQANQTDGQANGLPMEQSPYRLSGQASK